MGSLGERSSHFFQPKEPATRHGESTDTSVVEVENTPSTIKRLKTEESCVSPKTYVSKDEAQDKSGNSNDNDDNETTSTEEANDPPKDSITPRIRNAQVEPSSTANPFAKFAFQQDSCANPFAKFAFSDTTTTLPHEHHQAQTITAPASIDFTSTSLVRPSSCKKRDAPADNNNNNNNNKTHGKNKTTKSKKKWVRMNELPPEEQERVRRKWHGLVVNQDAPLEDKRFQVLVAARLHARCQEPVVQRCMQSLAEAVNGNLTVAAVAKMDPTVLAQVISSLQYYNVKARHLVKAAQEIQSQFGGNVPQEEVSLRQITGIGPVMADLLAHVSTRASFANDENSASSS